MSTRFLFTDSCSPKTYIIWFLLICFVRVYNFKLFVSCEFFLRLQGSLRLILVLLHDFPEFLCGYHFAFCDAIPANCIQLRNLILSAFPRNMRLPDPFTPNLRVSCNSLSNCDLDFFLICIKQRNLNKSKKVVLWFWCIAPNNLFIRGARDSTSSSLLQAPTFLFSVFSWFLFLRIVS